MSRPSRPVHVAAAVATGAFLLLSAVACGGDDTPSSTGPTTSGPAAAAPSGPVVTWAGTVCSDADALEAALRDATAAAPPEVDGSGTVPEQARADLKARADAVKDAGQALVTTVTTPPAGAGTELQAAADNLSEPATLAKTKIDAMWSAASSVAAATTPEATKTALEQLRSAALEAGSAVSTYASELRQAIGDADPPVRSAFAAAPECQKLPSS